MQFTLKFLKRLPLYDDVQPYKLHGYPELSEEQQSNCVYEVVEDVAAEDARECTRESFEYINAPSGCDLQASVFESEDTYTNHVIDRYITETMDLVRRRLTATLVIAIDWRLRRNDSTAYPFRLEAGDVRKQAISVATAVHCDFSYDGGHDRIKQHLNEHESRMLEDCRMRPLIVNVWRPLNIVRNAPLLLADRRTVLKSDVVEADQVMTDKLNKTACVFHRRTTKWYWRSEQTPDEVVMCPTWMPATDAVHVDFSPHAAAYLHAPDRTAAPRESIEVRTIAFVRDSDICGDSDK